MTYEILAEFTPVGLIGDAGIQKSIADHNFAAIQGGLDDLPHVLDAAGGVEQRLALGGHAPAVQAEDHLADALGDGAAAGLPGEHGLKAPLLQVFLQQGDLGGLAAAVAALQRDEQPPGPLSQQVLRHGGKVREHGVRPGLAQLAGHAVAVVRADANHAQGLGRLDVKAPVPAHAGLLRVGPLRQCREDQVPLVGGVAAQAGAGDGVEVAVDAEVLRQPLEHKGGLGRGDAHPGPRPVQAAQQCRHAGVQPGFVQADVHVPLPVGRDGRLGLLVRHAAVFHVAVVQRRADEPAQSHLGKRREAQLLQAVGHAPSDALAGVRHRAVKVKQIVPVFQSHVHAFLFHPICIPYYCSR